MLTFNLVSIGNTAPPPLNKYQIKVPKKLTDVEFHAYENNFLIYLNNPHR